MIDISPTTLRLRHDCRAIFDSAIEAVMPARFLPDHLPEAPPRGRLILLAAGKAGASMAAAAEAHYLVAGFPEGRLSGLAVTRHGYGAPLRHLRLIEAGHPMPDAASLAGAETMLALADAAGPEDLVVFLLSGGASANLVAPMGAITLAEKQALNRALLRSGAAIGEINTVRKHVSRIKGGRLAARIAPARVETIALSDVPGDDLAAIGSGPTVPDGSTLLDARMILARYGIEAPDSVKAVLADPANETLKSGDPVFSTLRATVAARPRDAFEAARSTAHSLGYRVVDLGADLQGEAREIAVLHAIRAREEAAQGGRVALLSGGELTVTIRGDGQGGPNQEYALALALALRGMPHVVALAGDTDGTDGGGGLPSDPAGALIDPATLARALASGNDATEFLARNDSTAFFAALGDLVQTGPTLTNANDLRVILIGD
jgi:hydroxypyruvate reductase